MAEIYALCEPDSGAIRYIGKANDSAKRLKSHMRDSYRRDFPVYRWMRKLALGGKTPTLVVLETAENWQERERIIIAAHIAKGCALLNVAEGGDEPHCPKEVRAENGRKNAAAINADPKRKRMQQIKMNLSRALRDGYVSEGTKAKMRLAAQTNPKEFGLWANV